MMEKLPKDWKWCKLNEVAEITSSKRIFQSDYVSEGIPFYRTKEIKELSEGKDLTIDLFISHEKYNEIKSKFVLPKIGDVLLSAVGTIGISYIVKTDKPFYFKDGNLMWFRNLSELDSLFLSYGLTNFIRYSNNAKTSGSAYSALTIETMKNFHFPLPPLKTQQQIVSKIEELFSELDKGVEDLKKAQQQLKTFRQSVLKWAFEGRLTNENVKDGVLPKRWKNVKMNEIVTLSSQKHSPTTIENIFYIGLEHIEKHSGKLTSKVGIEKISTVKNKFIKGDILYGKLRPNLNKVHLSKEDGVCSTDILVLKLSKECLGKYLHPIMLSSKFVNEMSENTSGVNLPRVSTKFIMNYEIPLPPIDEQEIIVQEIESRLRVADKLEENIKESLQKAEALRQSILKKAFCGELV